MKAKFSPVPVKIGFMCAALLVSLTGCVTYVDRARPGEVYVEPAAVVPVFIEQDDYVYYPQYGMYYGSRSHRYYRYEGRSWVARPEPRGVAVNVLFASPSVNVNFHDSPAVHHAEVVHTYPRNWKPLVENRGRKEDQRDDKKDNHKR